MEFIEFLEVELDKKLVDSDLRCIILEGDSVYIAKFSMPREYIITYQITKDDKEVLCKLIDAAEQIRVFNEMYMDGALHQEVGERFINLPGVFSFVSDEVDVRAKRLIGILMQSLYGRHNVYAIHVNEENIRVDTRAGRFYFMYDKFNVSVKKELELINRYMRKPIRKLILK